MATNSLVLGRVNTSSLLQILGGSLFLALCAQIQIPLPFTPVPISMQTLAVALIGAVLGKKKGALAVVAYLGEIMMGAPFLAGAVINPLALIGTNGGYLVGMVVQAYLVGWFYEKRMSRDFVRSFFFNMFCGGITLLMGCLWLAHFVGWNHVLALGCYPFLIGDVLKSIAVTRFMMKR